jgi:cyanophycinase
VSQRGKQELKHPEYSSNFRNIEANNIELKQGLGFVENAIIDQHFVKRSRHNRLISAIAEHPEILGIGIDESTAILVDKDTAEVVGVSQVLVFKNTNPKIDTSENGLLGTKGIVLDIYLPGEKFPLKK